MAKKMCHGGESNSGLQLLLIKLLLRTLSTIAQSVGHNERRRLPTLVVVLVRVAHMCRVIQPEDEDQALYDDFARDILGLVLGGRLS